jgi:hypothetical protein
MPPVQGYETVLGLGFGVRIFVPWLQSTDPGTNQLFFPFLAGLTGVAGAFPFRMSS